MLLLVRMCCLWYHELCSEIRSVVGGDLVSRARAASAVQDRNSQLADDS